MKVIQLYLDLGQSKYRGLWARYCRDSDAIVFVAPIPPYIERHSHGLNPYIGLL
jgi:hypothetical protein